MTEVRSPFGVRGSPAPTGIALARVQSALIAAGSVPAGHGLPANWRSRQQPGEAPSAPRVQRHLEDHSLRAQPQPEPGASCQRRRGPKPKRADTGDCAKVAECGTFTATAPDKVCAVGRPVSAETNARRDSGACVISSAVCKEVGPPGIPSCLERSREISSRVPVNEVSRRARDTGLLTGRSGLLQYAVRAMGQDEGARRVRRFRGHSFHPDGIRRVCVRKNARNGMMCRMRYGCDCYGPGSGVGA